MASVSGAHGGTVAHVGGYLSFAAAANHELVAGAQHGSTFGAAAAQPDAVAFAGQHPAAAKAGATQTVHPAGVTVSFGDGTSMTVLGASHLSSFFGH